jgi:hypothetical protein
LLGVFEAASGDPISGVEITDVLGTSRTETSATGLVSLFLIPEGARSSASLESREVEAANDGRYQPKKKKRTKEKKTNKAERG